LKILHTEASIGWGGQEMRTLKESLGMIEKGHEVIFAVQRKGGLVSQARKHGIKVYELQFSKKRCLLLLPEIVSIIRREKISLVNTHSSVDAWIAGVAARLCSVPVIRTRHLSTKIKEGLNSYLLYNKLADFVMTTCQEIVPMIKTQAKLESKYVKSVPTGINVAEILEKKSDKNSFRKEYNLSDKDFVIGMVCFMRSWKGVDDFIDAAHLTRNIPDLKWVIIGGGHQEKYRERAKDLGLTNLTFTGHLENPFPAISSIDVFSLLSTAHEGVSQASLQASLFQKPLIATATGGLKEVCVDQKTGIQVPLFSPKKVVEAALKLKGDPALVEKMGKEAKKLVEKKFSYENMLEQVAGIYENL
jgi:glycosyltransferase involved in cell wall biosynthesis